MSVYLRTPFPLLPQVTGTPLSARGETFPFCGCFFYFEKKAVKPLPHFYKPRHKEFL